MAQTRWIDLDGASNVRDVGGLPTLDGGSTRAGRLIRADSLQTLSERDVRHLVDDLGVRTVVDLRTGAEVRGEGPGPMTREPLVTVHHLSLFPEPADVTTTDTADGPVVLPWQERSERMTAEEKARGASGVYLRYLSDRPDSVLGALRLIGASDGATIVHCAAGKDRTGVVIAFALADVGVTPEAIVADYATTAERIGPILDRLAARDTYRNDLDTSDPDRHTPRAVTMERLLAATDEEFGGVRGWLGRTDWTEADDRALRTALIG